MNPVLKWIARASLRIVQPFISAHAIVKVLASADVFSLALFRALPVCAALLAPPATAPANAAAPCQGQIGPETDVTSATGYDPFSALNITDALHISIRNTGDTECSYALVFRSDKPGLLRLGDTLAYTLTDGRASLVSGAGAISPPFARTRTPIPPAGIAQIGYQMQIPRGQFAAPGAYRDTITLELYALDDGGISGQPLHTTPLSLAYTVVRAMSVNIKGGGTATTVNFGTLSTGQRQAVEIQARSNESYRFRVKSDNGGAMALTPAVPGQIWRVDYTATFDSEPLNLTGGHNFSIQPPTSPESDASHALAVTVGNTAQKRAGRYEDVITVEIVGAVP